MPTKTTPLDKPLTPRLQNELIVYAGLLGGMAPQILNADIGEVYARLTKEAVHATDVFYKQRVSA